MAVFFKPEISHQQRLTGLFGSTKIAQRLSVYFCGELGFIPLSQTGAELLFEVFSQRYERGSTIVLTGALLDRLTHHVHI